MNPPRPEPRSTGFEHRLHLLFAVGLPISAALVLLGVIRVIASGESRSLEARHVKILLEHSASGDPVAWVYLGIIALMLMPILSVVVSVASFGRLREWRCAAAATIVLLLLILSMTLGIH
jgi:uncharacterized membrane protein